MNRRNALKNMLAFIPFGAAFAGITTMGFQFITPKKHDITRKVNYGTYNMVKKIVPC
jgi:hypothetical protein